MIRYTILSEIYHQLGSMSMVYFEGPKNEQNQTQILKQLSVYNFKPSWSTIHKYLYVVDYNSLYLTPY